MARAAQTARTLLTAEARRVARVQTVPETRMVPIPRASNKPKTQIVIATKKNMDMSEKTTASIVSLGCLS